MKKSKMYEQAALSVIRDNILPATTRLEIIGELLEKKRLEKFVEEQEEKEIAGNE